RSTRTRRGGGSKARNGPPFRAFFYPGVFRPACHNPGMTTSLDQPGAGDVPAALDAHVARQLARLPDAAVAAGGDTLRRVAVASDFAIEVFARQPDVLAALLDDADAPLPPPRLDP